MDWFFTVVLVILISAFMYTLGWVGGFKKGSGLNSEEWKELIRKDRRH